MPVRYGNARLDVRFGVPYLFLTGSPYEMGFQYGILLKNRLKGALSRIGSIKRSLFSLFPFFIRPAVPLYFKIRTRLAEKKIPKDYIKELRGVADGSGLPYASLLFASTIAETLIGFGCTSILSLNKGSLLHSRNLDFFPPFLGNIPLIVHYRPEGKNPYTLVGFVGYLPGLTGMNEKGITLSLNESSCAGRNRIKKENLAGYAVRRILEESGSLKDVRGVLERMNVSRGWTLTAGSATEKNGVIFDITGDTLCRNVLKPRRYLYSVNTFVNGNAMKRYQCITRAGHAINHARKAVLDRSAGSVHDTMSAIRVLSDNCGVIGDSTVNNYRTLQTVIMDAAKGTVVFSSAPAYAGLAAYTIYDVRADRSRIFRKVSPELSRKDMKDFIRWMSILYEDPLSGLKTVLENKISSPFQLEAVFFLKDILKWHVPWDRLLDKIDTLLDKYPAHAQLLRWKGECLFRLKRYGQAINVLHSLLKNIAASPNDRMSGHALLAECFHAQKNHEECARHASASMKILRQFAAGPAEKKLAGRLKYIAHPIKIVE